MLKAKGDAKEPASSTPEQRIEAPNASIAKSKRAPAPAPVISLGFSASGESIIATIGACSTTLAKQDAIKACRDLLSLIYG